MNLITNNTPPYRPYFQPQTVLNRMLKRYFPKWPFFMVAVVIALCLALIYLRITKRQYEVKASIVVVDREKINTDQTALEELDLSAASKSVEIEMEVLHSRKLVGVVLAKLNMPLMKSFAAKDSSDLIDIIQEKYEVSLLNQKSSIVELRMVDVDPARAEKFLNTLIATYNEQNKEARSKLTQSNLDFIDSRLADLSTELNRAEGNIEEYKSSRSMTELGAESKAYLENLQKNDLQRSDVDVQLNIIAGIERSLANSGSAPATIGIDDDGLKSSIERLAVLQQERSKLLATTPETNHLFEGINSQIAITTKSINEKVRNIKSSLQNIKRGLATVNTRVESAIKSLPGQERGYVSIKRQQAIKEDLYNYLLKKREEVQLSYNNMTTDASVMDAAFLGEVIWPKKPLVFTIAIGLALLLTAGLIYLMEMTSNTALSAEEVEEALSTPILSELSEVKTDNAIVAIGQGNTPIAQQFRALRTNLYYVHGSRAKGRVTMVSSSRSGEGKSFAASNLAVSLAVSGRKTVVIDMDLHKPRIASVFGLDPEFTGVSNFLDGAASIAQILQPSVLCEQLFVIGSGEIMPNPSELIESDRLFQLIDLLKQEFDDVIIDTPPLHMVTDGYTLAQHSDASLYLIRKGWTKKTELSFIQRLYSEQRLPKLNLIFNGAPAVLGGGY